MDQLEFKAAMTVDDAGTITGTAWPFGTADRMGDLITKGAFTHAGTLPMLFAHNQAEVIGVWDSIEETDTGLTVKGRMLLEVERAREVRAMIQAKAVGGLSIGFITKQAKARAGGGRTISAVDLHEISIVAIPAHAGAKITSLKGQSMDPAEITEPPDPALEIKAANDNVAALKLRLDKFEAKLNRPKSDNDNDKSPSVETKAFGAYLRRGDRVSQEELKALTVTDDTQGGYLAPEEASSEFIRDLVLFSPIRSIASGRTTASQSVKYPRRTGITNALWESEVADQPESNVTFGQTEISTRQLTTYVDISNQLLADSAGQAEAEVNLALAEDFGQKEGIAFVKGDGVLVPEGFMTNANVAYTANTDTAVIKPDALIALMYALPAPYRNRGTWVMNGSTLAALRKVKDTVGQYLWQPSIQAGQPETILGRPVVEAVDMDDPTSGLFPIAFGDFQTGYRIVDRFTLSILVNPYLLATKQTTRIHATRRVGGAVIQPKAFRKLKMSAS